METCRVCRAILLTMAFSSPALIAVAPYLLALWGTLLFLLLLATPTNAATGSLEKRLANERLQYREPVLSELSRGPAAITVFLHAAVGIFKKKRPMGTNETWGYGREIMEELLVNMTDCGLLPRATVYVTLLGSAADRRLAEHTLALFNTSRNIYVLLSGTNLFVAELPTIKALHVFARRVHPRSRLLYFHTKGMRNMGKFSADWRRYAAHFLILRHELCLAALDVGYETCGVQMSPEEYMGNFFWARAGWVARRELELLDIRWNMETRFIGEDFLFSPTVLSNNSESDHYCLFFLRHNLYDCPTPRDLYSRLPLEVPSSKAPRDSRAGPVYIAAAIREAGLGVGARPRRLAPAGESRMCPGFTQVRGSRKDNHGSRCVERIGDM